MYRCWIFGSQNLFFENYNLIRLYESRGDFKIQKVIFYEYYDLGKLFGEKILQLPFSLNGEFCYEYGDIVLVLEDGNKERQIIQALENSGIPDEAIVPYRVLKICKLDFLKYMELKKIHPTILSMNCLGGMIYHALALKFYSPFINMRFSSCGDFIRFMESPREYLEQELVYHGVGYNEEKKVEYPMGKLGDIEIHLRHYKDFDSAYSVWEKRKKRINWDHIIATAYAYHPEDALKFVELPVQRKVCFTTFPMENEQVCCMNVPEIALWKLVGLIPYVPYIDLVDLLLTGEVHRL